MDIQRSIGADIVMAFDECPPFPAEYGYVEKSMHLTHRWLKRCLTHFAQSPPRYGYQQWLFPIVQGGTYKDLRQASAQFVAEQNCAGNAIGGLSVGEPAELMYEMTEWVCQFLPTDRPRYLMGVGTPANILEAIALGVDMFDCVMPTRNGRNGMLFTTQGIINIKNEKWKTDTSPLDPGLASYASQTYSKGYLRHLIVSQEILGLQIATLQNLSLYLWLVKQARLHIQQGDFGAWKKTMVEQLMQRL
jgi:queuine tRNA-ribosyltransferase